MDSKSSAWLIENIKRFGLKTPRFFKVWKTIGFFCILVGFIPEGLAFLNITPNDVISNYLTLAVKVAGAVMVFMSKITFDDADPKLIENKDKQLPFTQINKP